MENWMPTIIAAFITCIVTMLGTWLITKSGLSVDLASAKEHLRRAQLERENQQKEKSELITRVELAASKINELEKVAKKYEDARSELKSAGVVRIYEQPVILVGPRLVGKTSLVMQWHAPWIYSRLDRTQRHKESKVPVFDFPLENRVSHFAMPDLYVECETHLVLRVHDFPGEPDEQVLIRNTVIKETERLQAETKKNLGVILICMFDAEEAKTGISKETRQYYSGDLFRELRLLVAHENVKIDRLVLVFNKYDQLKRHFPNTEDDQELLRFCTNKFEEVFGLLYEICSANKVCEVFTVLSREEMLFKNRGATIVKGEAARRFVKVIAGEKAEREIIEQSATTYAAERFPL
jgi:GTPase SAR1 family protein